MARLADAAKSKTAAQSATEVPGQLGITDEGALAVLAQDDAAQPERGVVSPEGPKKATGRPTETTGKAAGTLAGGRAAKASGSPKKAMALGTLSTENEKINVCYYGPEGTGKTTDLAYMAHLGRVLYVNAEGGLIARRLKRLGVPIENIQVWPAPDSGETVSFQGLEDLFWHLKGDLLADPDSWAGVCWDSATEITAALLEDIVTAQVAKAERAGKDRDRFFTDISDYGTMATQVRQLLRKYRDLPCHFGMTALERRDTDDDGQVSYGPAVIPSLMSDIAGYMGIMIHTEVKEIDGEQVYTGRTATGTKYRAKDRFGLLPKNMATPTFDRVLSYMNETLTVEEDPEQAEIRARIAAAREAEQARKEAGGKKRSKSAEADDE